VSADKPRLWIIAGPNGAGKTTLARKLPFYRAMAQVQWLNPDEISKELLHERGGFSFQTASAELLQSTFFEAADLVLVRAKQLLESGSGVCVETVLSTDKYRTLVETTLQHNGFVGIVYVAVRSPQISAQRIAARFEQGGHDVPTEKLAARWQRSLEQLPWFVQRSHFLHVYDNSDTEHPGVFPRLIAKKKGKRLQILEPNLIPELTRALQQTLPS
jgi:predicted ABC-type ATPase